MNANQTTDKRFTVLMVDDNSFNINLLRSTLQGEYKVRVSSNGNEALQAATLNKPDLILLDVMMPGIDGYEVCSRLKSQDSTRDIPVIFISSMDTEADREKGLKLGAVGYIKKPFRSDLVMAYVRKVFAQRKPAASG